MRMVSSGGAITSTHHQNQHQDPLQRSASSTKASPNSSNSNTMSASTVPVTSHPLRPSSLQPQASQSCESQSSSNQQHPYRPQTDGMNMNVQGNTNCVTAGGATMATAISFATPENSPFVTSKKTTVLTSSNTNNIALAMAKSNINNSTNNSANINTISLNNSANQRESSNNNSDLNSSNTNTSNNMDSTKLTRMRVNVPVVGSVNNYTNTYQGLNICRPSLINSTATSVTPQDKEKAVLFKGSQNTRESSNCSSSSENNSATPNCNLELNAINEINSTESVTSNSHSNPVQEQVQMGANRIQDCGHQNQNHKGPMHRGSITPPSSSSFSSAPVPATTNVTAAAPVLANSGSTASTIDKASSDGNDSNSTLTTALTTDAAALFESSLLKRRTDNAYCDVSSTVSASTASTNMTSPSRVPSLRPRKLSESISSHTHPQAHAHTHVSSTCSDAGSVPPSLCSSASTPENDNKEEEKHLHHRGLQQQQQQQDRELRHAISETVGRVKQENDVTNCGPGYTVGANPNLNEKSNPTEISNSNVGVNMKIEIKRESENNDFGNHNLNQSKTPNNNDNNPSRNRNVNTSSPVPPTTNSNVRQPQARTPVRSPVSRYGSMNNVNGRFSVDSAPFGSPGIFLSPYLPSPPDSRKSGMGSLHVNTTGIGGAGGNKSSSTPTNFAKDFGKTDLSSSSFDANNALPWLSPTYSLFSPGGGIASVSNTPGGMFASIPRTPRTPNGSKLTLPLTTESKKKLNGISSMICVSPLASRKSTTVTTTVKGERGPITATGVGGVVGNAAARVSELSQPETPINFKEVFASPTTDSRGVIRADHSNEIPTLGHLNEAASNEEMCSRLSLEKHMAERDVREDEDLNVLLKLAETTPNRKAAEPKSSSRAFRAPFAYPKHAGAPPMYPMTSRTEPPVSLHLPFIGKNGASTGKARQKTTGANSDDFNPPPLPIRTKTTPSPSRVMKAKKEPKSKSKTKNEKASSQKSKNIPPTTTTKAPPVSTKTMYTALYPGVPAHLHHPHPGMYPPPPPHFMHAHGPYYSYPPPPPGSGHPPPPPYPIYTNPPVPNGAKPEMKKGQKVKTVLPKVTGIKRQLGSPNTEAKKRAKKVPSRKGGKRSRTTVTQPLSGPEREKSAATITAINAATGNKNDKAASLASAILRGVTMRPSGKWQAQLYYAGKSRYIGVFDTREKAALAYEIAREKLKTDRPASEQGAQSIKETEANVNAARKAAFAGVNEKDPRHGK